MYYYYNIFFDIFETPWDIKYLHIVILIDSNIGDVILKLVFLLHVYHMKITFSYIIYINYTPIHFLTMNNTFFQYICSSSNLIM